MITRTVTVREGENVGPVDWSHETAKDMPPIWREAERRPQDFTFSEYRRPIIAICMYDGWPYWKPTPAIMFIGPLNSAEWAFFNSYAVGPHSIEPRAAIADRNPEGGDVQQAPSRSDESGGSRSEIAQHLGPSGVGQTT